MPPKRNWQRVGIFHGGAEDNSATPETSFRTPRARRRARGWREHAEQRRCGTVPSGVLRNGESQNALLRSPAEMVTPTRTWKSLIVDPLRDVFPGRDALPAHGVVESIPTHQNAFTS